MTEEEQAEAVVTGLGWARCHWPTCDGMYIATDKTDADYMAPDFSLGHRAYECNKCGSTIFKND